MENMPNRPRRLKRRRWLVVVVAVTTGFGLLAAAAWLLGLSRYRPVRHAHERYGIDVSVHQGHIDWTQVARAGVSFAYIKSSEGGDFVDHLFADNWMGAGAARMDRGAYHFFTLCSPGAVQAQNFLRTVPNVPDALPAVVDLELAGNCRARPARATIIRELNDYLSAVEARTQKPSVLYVGDEFERRYSVRESLHRPLWERRFLRRPSNDWSIWQVDGYAHVNGVSGSVDLDVMR